MIKLINIVEEIRKEELDEFNAKKALATGALALGLAGSPNIAKAQDKIPTPTTQQKDTATTATATYIHPNQNTARSYATIKAKAALATKISKPEGEISASIVDSKMYQLKDGRYECVVTVELNSPIREGIDDPVQPGILKNRLGKLSCSRVRSAKSKLKNKGTHYAKALQRYLNYHC
jgi:hypothetical protein